MRRRDLTPDAARELEALDLALAGEPVAYDLLELERLVHDVRATAPAISPALTARLERIAEQGPATAPPTTRRRRPRRRLLVPALGGVAAVAIALAVVLSGGGDDGGHAPGVAGTAETTSAQSGGAGSAPAGASVAAAPPPPAGAIAPARARKVQRSAFLALSTGRDAVESTADDVIRTADSFHGIVASSSIAADDASGGEATIDLRIPTSRVDDALAALSKLGHVSQRRQDLQDITASFTSTQDRLDDARAERRALLRSLGVATSQSQIDSLRARLRLVSGQIAAAKTQLAGLRRRASYSSVAVTVRGDGKAASGGGWSPGDAAGDALHVLELIAGALLVALAVALPLGALGLALGMGARAVRTRRREHALDAV